MGALAMGEAADQAGDPLPRRLRTEPRGDRAQPRGRRRHLRACASCRNPRPARRPLHQLRRLARELHRRRRDGRRTFRAAAVDRRSAARRALPHHQRSAHCMKNILIATDAWQPQVNGVVRTLNSLAKAAQKLDVEISFLTPDGFPSVPVPTYPGLRCALPSPRTIARRIEEARPDAIHIATEGTIGHLVRYYCRSHGIPFTTSYTTRFPEYISARLPIPAAWSYAVLRRFHAAATVCMVSTPSLMAEFKERGFKNLGMWTRGVDAEKFKPERAIDLDLPRPIFVSVGRIAVEKNLEAFLSLDLPGSKIVIGQGPQEQELRQRFPGAVFLGHMEGETLAAHIAAADVFVFPSKTDT